MLSLRAHLPPTPELLGSSAVPLGRGPQRHGGLTIDHTGFPAGALGLGDTGRVAVDVSVPLPGADPGRFLRSKPDEALVELVRGGHEAAFEALYDRHHRGILAFCRHMLGSREEGEDALQHTFAAAYRDLTTTDKPIQLKAWLYTIARNRCLSLLRARREQVSIEDAEPSVEGLSAEVQRRQDL